MSKLLTDEEIDHLEFIGNRLIEIHDERPNVDYLIKFRKILRNLRESDTSDQFKALREEESPRSKLWRDVAAGAVRRGNDKYAVRVANKILEEYDAVFGDEENKV